VRNEAEGPKTKGVSGSERDSLLFSEVREERKLAVGEHLNYAVYYQYSKHPQRKNQEKKWEGRGPRAGSILENTNSIGQIGGACGRRWPVVARLEK